MLESVLMLNIQCIRVYIIHILMVKKKCYNSLSMCTLRIQPTQTPIDNFFYGDGLTSVETLDDFKRL